MTPEAEEEESGVRSGYIGQDPVEDRGRMGWALWKTAKENGSIQAYRWGWWGLKPCLCPSLPNSRTWDSDISKQPHLWLLLLCVHAQVRDTCRNKPVQTCFLSQKPSQPSLLHQSLEAMASDLPSPPEFTELHNCKLTLLLLAPAFSHLLSLWLLLFLIKIGPLFLFEAASYSSWKWVNWGMWNDQVVLSILCEAVSSPSPVYWQDRGPRRAWAIPLASTAVLLCHQHPLPLHLVNSCLPAYLQKEHPSPKIWHQPSSSVLWVCSIYTATYDHFLSYFLLSKLPHLACVIESQLWWWSWDPFRGKVEHPMGHYMQVWDEHRQPCQDSGTEGLQKLGTLPFQWASHDVWIAILLKHHFFLKKLTNEDKLIENQISSRVYTL